MSDLIEVRVSNLVGAALDWAVAMAEGFTQDTEDAHAIISPRGVYTSVTVRGAASGFGFRPSSNWDHGGPLIDKHRGSTQHFDGLAEDASYGGGPAGAAVWLYGPTALVAFCRGLVLHILGGTVRVPRELVAGVSTKF